VSDIALICGFDSKATFYRVFHKTYGMAPGASRAVPDDS
jgi:transcriptional regulator GlxA family with amidase domain